MKNLKTSVVLMLTVVLVFAMSTNVFADNLPSAVVSEVTGDGLAVETVVPGGTFTMDKAVLFSTDYEGKDALKESDLDNYGDWVCDFRITTISPDGNGLNGADIMLIGCYGNYGNIGFYASDLAPVVPDGDYDILYLTGLSTNLTYREVVNDVGTFKCGIVDVDGNLPLGTRIEVQLVMYENDDRANAVVHEVGPTVVYEKFNVKITDKDAYVDEDGKGYIRFISTVGSDETVTGFGTWIVPENFLTDGYDNAAKFSLTQNIAKNSKFNADIVNIPASYFSRAFYAKSFILTDNDETIWSDVATLTINNDKNRSSK